MPPDYDTYTDVSAGVIQLLRSFTNKVEVASIDEAFCDITGAICRLGEPRTIGELLRQSATLSYIDTVWILGVVCTVMVPLVMLTKRNQGAAPAGAHRAILRSSCPGR